MSDITYCVNASCPFKDCDRHLCRLQKKEGMVSIANLDSVCKRYIKYLVEVADDER